MPSHHRSSAADDVPDEGAAIGLEVRVVNPRNIVRHQHVHILPDNLLPLVSEEFFSFEVELSDDSLVVDRDDGDGQHLADGYGRCERHFNRVFLALIDNVADKIYLTDLVAR